MTDDPSPCLASRKGSSRCSSQDHSSVRVNFVSMFICKDLLNFVLLPGPYQATPPSPAVYYIGLCHSPSLLLGFEGRPPDFLRENRAIVHSCYRHRYIQCHLTPNLSVPRAFLWWLPSQYSPRLSDRPMLPLAEGQRSHDVRGQERVFRKGRTDPPMPTRRLLSPVCRSILQGSRQPLPGIRRVDSIWKSSSACPPNF